MSFWDGSAYQRVAFHIEKTTTETIRAFLWVLGDDTLSYCVDVTPSGGQHLHGPGHRRSADPVRSRPQFLLHRMRRQLGGLHGPDANAVFDYVTVEGAGYGYTGAVTAALRAEQPVTVTNSTFTGSCGWGILHAAGDLTDYATSNTFTNNRSGSIGTY